MRKKVNSFIVFALLLGSVQLVHAQEETILMQEPAVLPVVSAAPERIINVRPISQQLDFRTEIKNKRMETKQMDSSRGASMTVRISPIQDTQKRAIIQNLDTKFVSVNDSLTDTWAYALDQLEDMVMRAGSEAAGLETAGINTIALDASLARAKSAITSAKTAVRLQAEKSYSVSTASETMLKSTATNTTAQMRSDLRITYTSVSSAKTAVRSAMSSLVNTKTELLPTMPVATQGAVIGE